MTEIKKMENNMFKYKYEKDFKFSNLLYKYIKNYNNELSKSYEKKVKIKLMNINNSDISKLINMNDRIIFIDYFDILISH